MAEDKEIELGRAKENPGPKRRRPTRRIVLAISVVLVVLLLIWVWPPHPAPEAIAIAKANQWCLLEGGPSICLPGDQALILFPVDIDFDWAATSDFSKVAIIRHSGAGLVIVDTDSGKEIVSCTYAGNLRSPSWSPDGKVLAARRDGPGVALFELGSDSGTLSQMDVDLPKECDGATPPAVLGRDNFVVSGYSGQGAERRTTLWHVQASPKSVKHLASGYMPVAFSDTEVICWSRGSDCLLVNTVTGSQKVLVRMSREYSGWFRASPDRRFILFGQPGPLYLSTIRTWIAPVDGGKSMCLLDRMTTSCRSWSANATPKRVQNLLGYLKSQGIWPSKVLKSVGGKVEPAEYP